MSEELSQGTFQRSFAEQDEFADAFLFNRADPVLRKRVGMSLQMRRIATLKVNVSE